MKCVGVAIHQLDDVSPNKVLQEVKQDILPNTKFFDSLSLHSPSTIDEMFQRRNQYAMLEDDIVTTTKGMVSVTSDSNHYGESKGKRGRDE